MNVDNEEAKKLIEKINNKYIYDINYILWIFSDSPKECFIKNYYTFRKALLSFAIPKKIDDILLKGGLLSEEIFGDDWEEIEEESNEESDDEDYVMDEKNIFELKVKKGLINDEKNVEVNDSDKEQSMNEKIEKLNVDKKKINIENIEMIKQRNELQTFIKNELYIIEKENNKIIREAKINYYYYSKVIKRLSSNYEKNYWKKGVGEIFRKTTKEIISIMNNLYINYENDLILIVERIKNIRNKLKNF